MDKNTKIIFKNGSSIECVPTQNGNIRGKRSEEYINRMREQIYYWKTHPSEYIYYVTGKKLPLWQRVWIDKVYPIIKRIKI